MKSSTNKGSKQLSLKEKVKKSPIPRNKQEPFKQLDMEYMRDRLIDVFIPPVSNWNPILIRGAIDTHDNGNFNRSGRLVDYMMRDSRVMACVNTLVFGILGLPFEWQWQVEDADGGLVETKETMQYQPTEKDLYYLSITKKFWAKLMESSIPSLIMKNIVNMGLSIVSRNWKLDYIDGYDEKIYIPNMHIFHPSNIYFNTGTFQYYVTSYVNGTIWIDEKDERFQIVKHVDGERPWMQGAVRSVSFAFMDKWYALADWRSYLGIHGNPIRTLTTNLEFSTPPEFDIEQFIINLAISQQYGQPIQLPQGHTLDLLQANSANVGVFKEKLDDANKEIAIAYLGQNLTTDVTGGSFAAANVHSRVLQDYIEAYATTINRAMRKIIQDFYFFNFPDDVRVPIPFFNPALPIDKTESQKSLTEQTKALDTLAKAIKELSEVEGGKYLKLLDVESLMKKITQC